MKADKIKVLIGDDTADYGVKLASRLREAGFYEVQVVKDLAGLDRVVIGRK